MTRLAFTRLLAPLTIGLLLAGIALAACGTVNPEPPHPHDMPSGDSLLALPDGGDAGEAGP